MPQGRGQRSPSLRAALCSNCQAPVIWARIKKVPGRARTRAFMAIEIERCAPGTGNIALSSGLFVDDKSAPLAERVANGTAYREHRPHCAAATPAAPTRAFSAANFRKLEGGALGYPQVRSTRFAR
jgi:hypothetical protein